MITISTPFFFSFFDVHRWNDDDDDDNDDRKLKSSDSSTNLDPPRSDNQVREQSKTKISMEQYVDRLPVHWEQTLVSLVDSSIKQEPSDDKFVQQIFEGLTNCFEPCR